MNSQRTVLPALALAVLAGCTTPRATGPSRADDETWKNRFAALPTDYKPTERYDRRELKRLAASPRENPRRLMWLINRAGAEKDSRVRFLLDQREAILDQRSAGQAHGLALALHGYDYSVNGNQAALDAVLADLAAQPVGSDADAVVALSFVNEWDRSPIAIKNHFVRSDGAGSIARANFWWTREYLFPHAFRAYQAASRPAPPGAPTSDD
jgi:hypothetical protein